MTDSDKTPSNSYNSGVYQPIFTNLAPNSPQGNTLQFMVGYRNSENYRFRVIGQNTDCVTENCGFGGDQCTRKNGIKANLHL